jgi:hypothetical protein
MKATHDVPCKMLLAASVVIVAALIPGCGSTRQSAALGPITTVPGAERFHLGHHTFKVTTSSPSAQLAFDRGLTLAYAFSHQAADDEFRKAAAADPTCAMAWWGVALINGPHINFPLVPPDHANAAWDALSKAGMNMGAVASYFDSQAGTFGQHELRAEVVLFDQNAKAYFAALETQKAEIEKAVGAPLTWYNPSDKRMCRIYLRRTCDLEARGKWEEQHAWLKDSLEKLHSTFAPRVKQLTSADSGDEDLREEKLVVASDCVSGTRASGARG